MLPDGVGGNGNVILSGQLLVHGLSFGYPRSGGGHPARFVGQSITSEQTGRLRCLIRKR